MNVAANALAVAVSTPTRKVRAPIRLAPRALVMLQAAGRLSSLLRAIRHNNAVLGPEGGEPCFQCSQSLGRREKRAEADQLAAAEPVLPPSSRVTPTEEA